MPTPSARAWCLCAALLAGTLSACASQRLSAVAPAKTPQLAGNWTLDPVHSEHLDAAVLTLQQQLHKLMLRVHHPAPAAHPAPMRPPERHRPGQQADQDEGAPPAAAQSGAAQLQEPAVEVSAPLLGATWVREFIAHVPVGTYLGIGMTPSVFTLRSAGGVQQCTLGLRAAVAFGHGGADQTCGWRSRNFLIVLQPLIGPRLSERFALGPADVITMTLHLSGHGINVRLIRRYRRTPNAAPPVLLPTSD